MASHHDQHAKSEAAHPDTSEQRLRQRARTVAIAFAGLALAALLFEHRVHVLGALPYLVILLCPLMHFFMHGSHHHGHGGTDPKDPPRDPPKNPQ